MHISASVIAAAVAFFSTVNAHAEMNKPNPYGPASLNNSPLDPSGSDFPCKQRPGVYDPPVAPNTLTIGVPSDLSIMGSAVHGGGSCQVSLTTDMQPTKSSVWKVIHSIEGGCPANTPGNLGDDPNQGGHVFKFTVPSSIAPGDYTLAWTWFNRIGNREMYMNCAPVTVVGAPAKRYAPAPRAEPISRVPLSKRQDLPDMFIANINGCNTKEGIDIRFPNPGSSVDLLGESGNLMAVGQAVCNLLSGGAGPVAGGGGEAPPTNPGSFAPVPEPEESPAPPAQTPAPSATPAPAPPAPSPSSAPPAPPAPAPPAPAPPAPAPPAPAPGDGSSLSGACTEEGVFNCIGGTSFQQCASGTWSTPQPVAAGTACTAGKSADLGITVASRKRGLRHRRAIHIDSN